MSIAVAFKFPWGRYHANPWGRHVNEAAVEWPPSPWRILRSLYATWCNRLPELDEITVIELLGKLAEPPAYTLPEGREAHTRHYFPDRGHRGKVSPSTDKAVDAFMAIERGGEVVATWTVDLTSGEQEVLSRILESLPYLGRAESTCEARLLLDDVPMANVHPVGRDDGSVMDIGRPLVRVLSPTMPLDIRTLTARPIDIRSGGLVEPPGTCWQPYRRSDVPVSKPSRQVSVRPSKAVTAVRWAIAMPSSSSTSQPRPSIHDSVVMADMLRSAAMSKHKTPPSPTLAGKDASGVPLRGHQHAHYLAIDADGDRLLDQLVVWAPGGLNAKEIAALASIEALETKRGAPIPGFRPCQLGIEAVGDAAQVLPDRLLGESRIWESCTPFAPARHAHRQQDHGEYVEHQVREELAWRGLPAPREVEAVEGQWLSFRRHRIRERLARDTRPAYGVRLVFDQPVGGPIALGALSHFGLGLFAHPGECP